MTLISIMFFISMVTTGCKFESLKSPEKLLEMPTFDEDNKNVYIEIKKLTPADTSFLLPKNANDVGKINSVNLDGDDNKELVVFKRKENDNPNINSVYMYIFETERNTIKDDTEQIIRMSGDSIKYANFIDLNNDNKNEIVLQVVNKGFESIYVFKYENGVVKKLAEHSIPNQSIRLNYYDYNNDGKKECLALVQDMANYEVAFSEMILEKNKLVFKNGAKSKNVDNLEKVNIINGEVSDDIKGTVVIYQNISGSYITQIIVYKDGKFLKALNEEYEEMKNPIILKAVDIDNDRIYEIPKMEFKYSNNTTNEARVISWYKWNGKLSDEAKINLSDQIFYCYDYNFKIIIPDALKNKFFIRQNYDEEKSTFQFFYKNYEEGNEKLFDIVVDFKNTEDYDKNKRYTENNVLYEIDSYVYYLTNINESNLKKYNLKSSNIKKYFYQINK